MKKYLLLTLILCLCLAFASCKKDPDDKGQHTQLPASDIKVTFVANDVKGNAEGDTLVNNTSVKYYVKDAKLEKPEDPEKPGYTFEGWFVGEVEWDFDEMVVAEEMTLTAEWSVGVSYNLGSGTNSENNPNTIYSYATYPLSLSAPTRDGFAFDGWYLDAEFTQRITSLDSFKPYTVYAKWAEGSMVDYTVKVQSAGGMPLADAEVFIHKGEGNNEIAYKKTDANGIATFSLLTPSDYSVQIDALPDGYIVTEGLTKADRYPLTAPETVISLTSAPTDTPKNLYKVGDVIHDFTITDVDGVSYTLSDMLKTKELVVLNYWFITCGWCEVEFPEINSAYNKYKDKVAVFGMNNSSDTKDNIIKYGEDNNLDFPLVKINQAGLNLKNFGKSSCPTTILIDRYGVIVSIHSGAVCESTTGINDSWDKIFVAFIGENYQQKLITNIESFWKED